MIKYKIWEKVRKGENGNRAKKEKKFADSW